MLGEGLLGRPEAASVAKNEIRLSRVQFVTICIALVICSVGVTYLSSSMAPQLSNSASNSASSSVASLPAVIEPCIVPDAPSRVPIRGMYAANRLASMQRLYEQLNRNSAAFNSAVIYVQGGADEVYYYSDTDRLFRQESNFLYLSGYESPGLNNRVPELVIIPSVNGNGVVSQVGYLFVEECDAFCQVWNGEAVSLEQLRARYDTENINWRSQMASVLTPLLAGRGTTYTFPGVAWSRSAAPSLLQPMRTNTLLLQRTSVPAARAIKTPSEMILMRTATEVSAAAHAAIIAKSKQSRYLWEYGPAMDFEYFTGACGHTSQSYLSISPSGVRTAVLHYNINDKPINTAVDMVLLDAGSEWYGYGTDITRTWPVSGTFTNLQQITYNAVLAAQSAAISLCRAGASWAAVSRASTVALTTALINAGIITGNLEQSIAAGVHTVFMPHGLGHYVGIDVHDSRYFAMSTLQPGMVFTVEPGCYFIPIQIANARNNPARRALLDFDRIAEFMAASQGLGGVRIEDVITILPNGEMENLSARAPRSVADIEKLYATGSFTASEEDKFMPWLAYPNQSEIAAAIAKAADPEFIKLTEGLDDIMMLEPLV